MSRSYWLSVIAAIGWLALAGWAEGHGGGKGAYYQQQAATAQSASPSQELPPHKNKTNSISVQTPCKDGIAENQDDLCQQWRMAEAADSMVQITGWQLLLSVASVVGLIVTITYSRIAASAAIKTVEAIHTIERAYIFVSAKRLLVNHNSSGDIQLHFKIVVRNAGKTPAILVKHRFLMVMLSEYPDSLDMAPDTDLLPPGKIVSAGKASISKDKFAFSEEDGKKVIVGDAMILCLGEVLYKTVDGKDRATGFCWEFRYKESRFEISPTKKLNYQT